MVNLFVKAHTFFIAKLQKFIANEVMRFRVQGKEESTQSDFTELETEKIKLEVERQIGEKYDQIIERMNILELPPFPFPSGTFFNLPYDTPTFIKHPGVDFSLFICIQCLFFPRYPNKEMLDQALDASKVIKTETGAIGASKPMDFLKPVSVRVKPVLECETCHSGSTLPYMEYTMKKIA